jgi:hypothetical protein
MRGARLGSFAFSRRLRKKPAPGIQTLEAESHIMKLSGFASNVLTGWEPPDEVLAAQRWAFGRHLMQPRRPNKISP